MKKCIEASKEEQEWLKKEMEGISEVLINRNYEIKELKKELFGLEDEVKKHIKTINSKS